MLLLGLLALPMLSAQARSLEEIRATGTLRICVAGASAPLYQANGEAFARFLGVQAEVRRLASFDEQFHNAAGVTVESARYEARLLGDGSCDVFPNDLHIVAWRELKMLLVPYYTVRKVIVARRALRATLEGVADLKGRSAAVQEGTAYDTWLMQMNSEQFAKNPVVITYASTEESVRLVAEGAADFTVLGTEGAFKWVRGDVARLAILFPVDDPVPVGWGVRLGAKSLAAELERFFAESRRVGSDLDGNWQQYYRVSLMEYQLYQASFGSGKLDFKAMLVRTAPAIAAVLALLVAMLVWALRSSIRHRKAVDALRSNLEATVAAVASTVESRDPYTAGHQRRVAELAAAIAGEMGLKSSVIQGIRFGALIHDLGKVQVPEELLAKPTGLTKWEFELLKAHPQVGYEIVKDIQFPWPVAAMIRQHHERLDGSGYPQGLKGEEILIEARILAVADVVEAMASHRPYRPGLGIEVALAEIEKNAGRWYDHNVAAACLSLFRKKSFVLANDEPASVAANG
ncbi:MAG: HD domain-containing protein [Betaproteobacteria bacterium]|nr:HD domain-containing protein [Betaproteobacteria bacterium]